MKKAILKRIAKAEKILRQEREELLRMVTAEGIDDFGNARDFMPYIEEDTKYQIRALRLPHYLLEYYLNKLCDIYGSYSGDQPDKRKKHYDNDIYLSD